MTVNFGGWVALSTVDYPGYAATVIFLRGCKVRCEYCHNKHLWEGHEERSVNYIYGLIDSAKDFINAVVISGGEPLEQPDAVRLISNYARSCGLKVGIHTSGEGDISQILPYADMILLSRPGWNRSEKKVKT